MRKVKITQGLLRGGINPQRLGEVVLDGAVLRLHLVEGSFEVFLPDTKDGLRDRLFSAPGNEGVNLLLVERKDVVVATQAIILSPNTP